MLKGIIFIIADPRQREPAERLAQRLRSRNGPPVLHILTAEGPWEEKMFPPEGKMRDGILFFTDHGQVLRRLKDRGAIAVAYLHENNREQDLSGADYAVTDIEELPSVFFERAYLRGAGLPWTVAETKRCILRETTVEDVDAFYEIYSAPSITRFMDRLYDDPLEEKEYTKNYIREIYGFYGYGLWTAVHRDSGRVIGRAGLSHREGFSLPELGFVIAAPFQRKGYAFELCEAILAYAGEELGFQKVQALVMKGNEASVRLCGKLGFVPHDRVESAGSIYERFLWESPAFAADTAATGAKAGKD